MAVAVRIPVSMAVAVPLSFSLDQFHQHKHRHHFHYLFKSRHDPNPFLFLRKSHRHNFKSSFSSSSSSSSSSDDPPSSSSITTTSTPPPAPLPPDSPSSSVLQYPFRSNRFLTALTNEEYEKLKFLEDFRYYEELESGSLRVRAMRADEMDVTVNLLAESFAESMVLPVAYVKLLSFLVKQYLTERMALMPHTVTLVGFYRGNKYGGEEEEEKKEEEEELAGTVEVCFDKMGANDSPPTPTPPKESPYICNMTVKKPLRRRGIGWHLLKASEKLISHMTSSKEVYLHCRMIDAAPFNMYTKAGYKIVKTDSIFILLTLQRRKHLMCKNLPILDDDSELDISGSDEELNL